MSFSRVLTKTVTCSLQNRRRRWCPSLLLRFPPPSHSLQPAKAHFLPSRIFIILATALWHFLFHAVHCLCGHYLPNFDCDIQHRCIMDAKHLRPYASSKQMRKEKMEGARKWAPRLMHYRLLSLHVPRLADRQRVCATVKEARGYLATNTLPIKQLIP